MFTLPVTTLINSPPIILRRSYTQIDILLHDNITDKLFQKHFIKNAAFNNLLTRSETKHYQLLRSTPRILRTVLLLTNRRVKRENRLN